MRSPEVELATRRPFVLGVGWGLLALLAPNGPAWAADKKLIRIGVTKIVAHPALDAAETLTAAGLAPATRPLRALLGQILQGRAEAA